MTAFKSLMLSIAVGFGTIAPALCADPVAMAAPSIKADVIVNQEIVTLGDLVENAGTAGSTPIFRAPDLGTRGNVSTWRIEEAARKAGLQSLDLKGLASISVERAARTIRADHVHDVIQEAIADKLKVANINSVAVTFDEHTPVAVVENTSKAAPVVSRMDWNPATNRFEAVITIPDSRTTQANPIVYRGTASEMVNVAVLKRSVNRGSVISSDDFTIETQPRMKLAVDAITDVQTLNGMSAKRQISAGQHLKLSDVERSRKVNKNDMVTIMFETGGITLSTRGKAMADGALGDVVAVQNTQSKKILEGRIVGAGMVSIEPAFHFRKKSVAIANSYER